MTTFTTVSKSKLSWAAPETVAVASDYYLDIGSGFNLLISDTYKLVIQPGRAGTAWTMVNKSR